MRTRHMALSPSTHFPDLWTQRMIYRPDLQHVDCDCVISILLLLQALNQRAMYMYRWKNGEKAASSENLCIPAGSFFAKDVVSYLPYREVITKEFFDLMEAIIDDNQIILKEVMLFCPDFSCNSRDFDH